MQFDLTVEDVAKALGVSVATVKRKAALLGARKQRGGWVFSEARVLAFQRAIARRASRGAASGPVEAT